MKTYFRYILGIFMLIVSCTVAIAKSSDDLDTSALQKKEQIEQSRRAIKKKSKTPDLDPSLFDYNNYVAIKNVVYQTSSLHNMIKKLRREQLVLADYKTIIDDYEDLLARYKSNRSCNIELLSPYYTDPESAWNKITEEAYSSDNLISASITNDSANGSAKNDSLARWNIGYKFIMAMYAGQAEYGTVKKAFPLWADQKYQYNQDYMSFYASLANDLKKSGVDDNLVSLIMAGPTVEDDVKYDATRYNELVAKHNELLQKVSVKIRVADVITSLPLPPKAPVALPPWKEIVYEQQWSEKDYSGNVSFYPVTPQPWVSFITSNFKKFNKDGEMAKILKVVSQDDDYATIRFNTDLLPLNKNRIERYLVLREAETERRPVAAQVKLIYDEKSEALRKNLKEFGISADDVDFSNSEDIKSVIELIKEKKITNIDLAKKGLAVVENPYKDGSRTGMDEGLKEGLDSLKSMVDALQIDSEGLTDINNLTSSSVKDAVERETANQALIDRYREIAELNKAELMTEQSSWCPIY